MPTANAQIVELLRVKKYLPPGCKGGGAQGVCGHACLLVEVYGRSPPGRAQARAPHTHRDVPLALLAEVLESRSHEAHAGCLHRVVGRPRVVDERHHVLRERAWERGGGGLAPLLAAHGRMHACMHRTGRVCLCACVSASMRHAYPQPLPLPLPCTPPAQRRPQPHSSHPWGQAAAAAAAQPRACSRSRLAWRACTAAARSAGPYSSRPAARGACGQSCRASNIFLRVLRPGREHTGSPR